MYDYSSRVLAHRPMSDYSLWHCLTYVFYAPLYLAGPTLTFNAFVSHVSAVRPCHHATILLCSSSTLRLAHMVLVLVLMLMWMILVIDIRELRLRCAARSGLVAQSSCNTPPSPANLSRPSA